MSLYKPKSINECPECKRLRGDIEEYTGSAQFFDERDRLREQVEELQSSRFNKNRCKYHGEFEPIVCPSCKLVEVHNLTSQRDDAIAERDRLQAELRLLQTNYDGIVIQRDNASKNYRTLKAAVERVRAIETYDNRIMPDYEIGYNKALEEVREALGATPTPENCFGVFTPPEPEGDA